MAKFHDPSREGSTPDPKIPNIWAHPITGVLVDLDEQGITLAKDSELFQCGIGRACADFDQLTLNAMLEALPEFLKLGSQCEVQPQQGLDYKEEILALDRAMRLRAMLCESVANFFEHCGDRVIERICRIYGADPAADRLTLEILGDHIDSQDRLLPIALCEKLLGDVAGERLPYPDSMAAGLLIMQNDGVRQGFTRTELVSPAQEGDADQLPDIQITDSREGERAGFAADNFEGLLHPLMRLKDSHRHMRGAYISLAAKVSHLTPSGVNTLIPLLQSDRSEKQAAALAIFATLTNGPWCEMGIGEALGLRQRERFAPFVLQAAKEVLKRSEAVARADAIGALAGIGRHSEPLIDEVIACLADQDSEVRRVAVSACGLIGYPLEKVEPVLLSLWNGNFSNLLSSADRAAEETPSDPEAVVTAVPPLDRSDSKIGLEEILWGLAAIADRSRPAEKLLLELLDTNHPTLHDLVKGAVIQVCRLPECKRIFEALTRFPDPESPGTRFYMMRVLSSLRMRGRDTLPHLKDLRCAVQISSETWREGSVRGDLAHWLSNCDQAIEQVRDSGTIFRP